MKENRILFMVVMSCYFVCSFWANEAMAQNNGNINIMSPEVWAFMKYGNTSTNLYTGTVHVDIPIYNYSDDDFDIPISIGYASNGYMPNVQTSSLGLGWFLNAGGNISREIRGLPDEHTWYAHMPYYGYNTYHLLNIFHISRIVSLLCSMIINSITNRRFMPDFSPAKLSPTLRMTSMLHLSTE